MANKFIKNPAGGSSLMLDGIGNGYSTSNIETGTLEGRMTAGYSIAPNDVRVYLGAQAVISNDSFAPVN